MSNDTTPQPDETRAANLLLEARLLRSRGETDAAADRFAEAAEAEEQLAERYAAGGDRATGWQHAFSAAGCWAQAGNFYAAIAIGDGLLAEPGLPPVLRDQVRSYVAALRARREQWAAGLPTAGVAGG
jgi:hypothetical protein